LHWLICDRIWEIVHGAPVFKGRRLPVETVIGSVDTYMELGGLSESAAIEATYHDFPTAPGSDAIQAVLSYFDTHRLQLRP
jgi:uncharacterized protein (DUF433 family)